MGNNHSSIITINVDRPNAFYFAGETISGAVELNLLEEKIEADQVYIALTGETGYTTTRTVSENGGQSTRTETDYHHIPFYSAKLIVAQSQPGQKELKLTSGQYSWPFQFLSTGNLPPTINKPECYPHVRYYLHVVIEKPWYKRNKRQTKYITVFPHVNLLQNPQCLQPAIFGNHNRKDIELKGSINKTGYVPGEIIHITFEIENPRRVLIKNITLTMLQSYQIGPNSGGIKILQATIPNIMNSKDQHLQFEYSVELPYELLAPSYQFHGGLSKVASANLYYQLKLEVHVEGMFTNFNVDIPIILGTEPNSHLNNQQRLNSMGEVSYFTNLANLVYTDHNEPPSYESVIQHKN